MVICTNCRTVLLASGAGGRLLGSVSCGPQPHVVTQCPVPARKPMGITPSNNTISMELILRHIRTIEPHGTRGITVRELPRADGIGRVGTHDLPEDGRRQT